MRRELFLNAIQFTTIESKALAKRRRPTGTVQIKQCFLARADDMNMRWTMVIPVDDHEQSIDSENGRHRRRIAYS